MAIVDTFPIIPASVKPTLSCEKFALLITLPAPEAGEREVASGHVSLLVTLLALIMRLMVALGGSEEVPARRRKNFVIGGDRSCTDQAVPSMEEICEYW